MTLTMTGGAAPLLAIIVVCATIAWVAWINRNRPKAPDISLDEWWESGLRGRLLDWLDRRRKDKHK